MIAGQLACGLMRQLTGIIVCSKVAIVPPGDTAKLQNVEDLFALCPAKIQVTVSDIVALPLFGAPRLSSKKRQA